MLSDAALDRIAKNLAALKLDPLTHMRVIAALAPALMAQGDEPSRAGRFPKPNGADVEAPRALLVRRTKAKRKKPGPNARAKRRREQQPARAPDAALGIPSALSKRDAAIQAWLARELANGPVACSTIEAGATRRQYSNVGLERAKAALGVTSFRPGNGAKPNEVCYSLTPDPGAWRATPA